jgi:hypothetical protein
VEKLLSGCKRTQNSKSEISSSMRNVINSLRGNVEIDKMIVEATKKLTLKQ